MQRATIASIGHYLNLVPSPGVTQVTSNSVVDRLPTKSAQHPPISDSVAATTPTSAPQANRRGGLTPNGSFARASNATRTARVKAAITIAQSSGIAPFIFDSFLCGTTIRAIPESAATAHDSPSTR